MSELPHSWTLATIGHVTVDCTQKVPADDEAFTYIDIASVDRSTKCVVSPQALVGKNAPSRARKLVRAGDVLVSLTRPNLNAVALVPDYLDGQIASTGFDVLRANGIDSRWLFYLVRTQNFVERMSELVQGALYPAVRSKDVRSYEAPLAPLNEQKRIADKLDAVLARVDACRERLDCIPAILKRFRQSVLAAATSGKLTEEWRGEHEVTDEWSISKIADVAFVTKLAGFEYTKFVKYREGGNLKVIKAENAGKWGFKYTDFSTVFSDEVSMLTRSKIQEGDVLMVFVGAGTGQVARVPSGDSWFLGPNIAMIRTDSDRLNSAYLEHYCRSPKGCDEISKFIKSVAQPSLSMKTIRQVPIPLPTIEEQQEIIRRVEELFAYADRLEARYITARAQVEKLTPALLAKAFRGELVPQDPNDEPASVLLERIRENRAIGVSKSKPRTRKQQLKTQMASGRIVQPEVGYVKKMEAN